MKSQREGSKLIVQLEGAIGETTPLFMIPLHDIKELSLDMTKVTYINSIGVKNWILWTLRIPKDCKIKLLNVPFVIASQASIVLGFVTPAMSLESIRVPYTCEGCGAEEIVSIARPTHYDYATAGQKAKIALPANGICAKCKTGKLEPDFMIDKTFKFLG